MPGLAGATMGTRYKVVMACSGACAFTIRGTECLLFCDSVAWTTNRTSGEDKDWWERKYLVNSLWWRTLKTTLLDATEKGLMGMWYCFENPKSAQHTTTPAERQSILKVGQQDNRGRQRKRSRLLVTGHWGYRPGSLNSVVYFNRTASGSVTCFWPSLDFAFIDYIFHLLMLC